MKHAYLMDTFNIDRKIIDLCALAESELEGSYKAIEETADYNQMKVLSAMQKNKLGELHFAATTGYGYNDLGRDVLEKVYADIFHTEDALVRIQMISGTHAITTALFGNLKPGDELLLPAGKPYDTLEGVIGIRKQRGSLADIGISHCQIELLEDGSFDYEGIRRAIKPQTKMAAIQRSKGYSFRKSFTISEISALIQFIKSINSEIICFVDNCYGEFTQELEPTDAGADIVAGSLIKNIGGGLAPAGGYVAGKQRYVENAAFRLTSPALGKEAGPSLGFNGVFFQGLFLAPQIVGGCLKGAVLASRMFEKLGYEVSPGSNQQRSDIVQAVKIGTPEGVKAFCRGIQKAAPVDSYVTPEPWAMPGYGADVVMAAGAFVQGSSIELSADAPMADPYIVYMQGGLSYAHAKIGILFGMQEMLNHGMIKL